MKFNVNKIIRELYNFFNYAIKIYKKKKKINIKKNVFKIKNKKYYYF